MPGIFPVANTGGGQCAVFPDVCMTPGVSAGAPGPLPYPNMAMLTDGDGSKKCKIKGKEVLRENDTIRMSSGDDAGTAPGGTVSGTFKGQAKIMKGWPTVKAEGSAVGHMTSVVGQNGSGGKNAPMGLIVAVSITNVKVGVDAGMPINHKVGDLTCKDCPTPDPASKEELEESKQWGQEKKSKVPPMDDELANQWRERKDKILKEYEEVMRGKKEPPQAGVTRDRLRMANEGLPGGDRIPLNFPSIELYRQFQAELTACLVAGGIPDATVIQIGSGTTGWKGNPTKKLPDGSVPRWSPTSDIDFAVFSDEGVAQAKEYDCAFNEKYGVFKNGAGEGNGFYDTPAGHKLKILALRWTIILYGDANADGLDFKLNPTNVPFHSGIKTRRK